MRTPLKLLPPGRGQRHQQALPPQLVARARYIRISSLW